VAKEVSELTLDWHGVIRERLNCGVDHGSIAVGLSEDIAMVPDVDKRPRTRSRAYEKVAITLPRELAQAVRQEAEASHAPSLSAYFAEKMAEALERGRLLALLDEMDAKYGPPGPEEVAWAKEALFGD